jgi:signal transduction histidine kinase
LRLVVQHPVIRTFAGRLVAFVALSGLVLVAALAAAGYALVSTIGAADEALSTYADELILAWSLQEAHERRLASGRGFLLARDEPSMRDFDEASTDADTVLARLRERVEGREGVALLAEAERALADHDGALRDVIAMKGSRDDVAEAWATGVRAKAARASEAMHAFIRHKEGLFAAAKEDVARAQQRAAWVMGSTALAALLVAGFVGSRFMRSAQRIYAAEQSARTTAERERAFFFALLDQLPMGIVAADASGTIMHVSRFAHDIRQSEEPPWPEPGFVADSGTWPVADELPLARALRGEVVANAEIRSASDRHYSVTAGPVRDERGTIVAAVAAFVDISERKRAERERELFIGALGHDLRNPLQAISLAAESLARRDDLCEAAKRPAMRIFSSATRMSQLISDLLDFARSQHGAIPINPERCEPEQIAADVIAEIKLAAPDCEFRVEHQSGCTGQLDPARITQVFQNLLVNAVQHGASGAPITVRTGCDDDHVWAKVTNRGTIPRDELRRIFEPFRSRPTSQGLGLGLYIARAIVEAHGGTIGVECNDDCTTFMVRLPHGRADVTSRSGASTRRAPDPAPSDSP